MREEGKKESQRSQEWFITTESTKEPLKPCFGVRNVYSKSEVNDNESGFDLVKFCLSLCLHFLWLCKHDNFSFWRTAWHLGFRVPG